MEVRRDNLTEFAARLGISATTVSRVLAGKGDTYRIATKTQERVLAEARKSGLRLNQVARGLRTHTLGIVVPDIANPFFGVWPKESSGVRANRAIPFYWPIRRKAPRLRSKWWI